MSGPRTGVLERLSVLIVDDQALVRRGLRMILETEPDLEVVDEAENGADAVSLVASTRPDVVLMDVRMPGVDGIEALEVTTRHFDLPREGFSADPRMDRVVASI